MDLVLFGIQGSGKGTLSTVVAEKFGYTIFETGSALRGLSNENSPLGEKVKSIIESGKLVPNEVVMEIIQDFMGKLPEKAKVLFDGIPRQNEQAKSFDELMSKLDRDFTGVLIDVPVEVSMQRLTSRRVCKNCKTTYPRAYAKTACEKCGGELVTRSDDNETAIKTRIETFLNETVPVIENYKAQNKLVSMDGNCDMALARERILSIVAELTK